MKQLKIKLHLYDLEMFSSTSMCDFYRAYYYDRYGQQYCEEGGFLYYNKNEIKRILREKICQRLNKKSQYTIYS